MLQSGPQQMCAFGNARHRLAASRASSNTAPPSRDLKARCRPTSCVCRRALRARKISCAISRRRSGARGLDVAVDFLFQNAQWYSTADENCFIVFTDVEVRPERRLGFVAQAQDRELAEHVGASLPRPNAI